MRRNLPLTNIVVTAAAAVWLLTATGCGSSTKPPTAPRGEGSSPTTRDLPLADGSLADGSLADGSLADDPETTTAAARFATPDPCEPLKLAVKTSDTAGVLEDLSICEESAGHYIDALKDAQRALERAIGERNAGIMQTARSRVKSLLNRVPHITFTLEQLDTDDLVVRFDRRSVPIDALTKKFSIDPGDHIVEAFGKRHGHVVRHVSKLRVAESEFVAIRLNLQ